MPAIAAIVPVGTLEGSKSRLGDALDAEEREELADRLLTRTLVACLDADALSDVLVISPDRAVLRRAADLGARTLRQRTTGLNNGLQEARDDVVAGGAQAILVLPIDLAFISAHAVEELATSLTQASEPTVLVVTDRHGTGTNVLGVRPPDAIDFAFGQASRDRHRAAAEAAAARYLEPDGPLAYDIDTPADLVLVESLRAEELHAG
jgi:2-phospho-L-lactate/phosphoenolpyruvate guanylyltransferase